MAAWPAPSARALPDRADDLPVVDGTVQTVLRTPERIYVGGNFTHVSAPTGPFFLADAAGAPRLPTPDVSGGGRPRVSAMVPDGAGGYYIVGSFTHVDGLPRLDAARILADGSVDPSWDPSVPGEISAVQRSGDTVYIGGHFSSVDGLPRSNLAAVDATTGQATSFAPQLEGWVSALAVSGSSVYFSYSGGSEVNGVPRTQAAAVDATTGATLPWNPEPNRSLVALAVAGGEVYLGGEFTQIKGSTRKYLAAVDATTGADTGFEAQLDSTVITLAISGSTIYVGGLFTHAGATAVGHAAAFDLDGNLKPAWAPDADDYVWSIATDGTTVYLGGGFTHVNGSVARSGFAAVDPVTGAATGWAPTPNQSGSTNLVALSGTNVAVAGEFTQAGGVARRYVAAFSATDGSLLPWNPDPDAYVDAIVDDGSGVVYIGGAFEHLNGGVVRSGLAQVKAGTGAVTSFNTPASGRVTALALAGDTLYVGGAFLQLGNEYRWELGAIDVSIDTVTPFDARLDGTPYALLVHGSTLYVGGVFTEAGGVPRAGAAAFPTTPTSDTPTAWNPDPGGVVSMAQRGGTLYLASETGVVAVDDATGAAVPGFGLSVAGVDSVAVAGDTLYLGGDFESVNDVARRNAAAVDAATGAVMPWDPRPNVTVYALSADPSGSVTIGGEFTTTELRAASGFASYSDPPAVIAPPSVGGNAVVGGALTCAGASFGGAQPQSTTLAWLRDGGVIAGATGESYVADAADVGHTLACRVVARNLGGSAGVDSAGVVVQAGASPLRDRTPPKVSALKLRPSSFRAARKGGPTVAKRKARKDPGAVVSYKIDEAARITFTVQRPEPGRRKGKSCVKPVKKLDKARRCTRYVTVKGAFTRTVKAAGADRFTFTGRLGHRTLARGSYRLALVAVDAAGNRAAPVTKAFRVTGAA
ncbi:MAG: hypothetical protein QM729_17515 [Solirubrobacterales bacterium]